MIQRQQTLWLLLSTLAALLCFVFPFGIGKVMDKNNLPVDSSLKAASDFLLLIFTGASLLLSGFIIFLYKDRKLQMKLCLVGMLLALVMIMLFVSQYNKLNKSTLALFAILPFLNLIGYVMAWKGIRKDEKLVKSLDKLR